MKSILLTRPLLDSLDTRYALKKYGYKVYIEPILTLRYLHPNVSEYEFDVVISTSKNSVRALSHMYKVDDLSIVTVGSTTMQTAKDLGFAEVISADGNIDDLISLIKNLYSREVKFLYIRGQEVSCDLKKKLFDAGFNVREVILYKMIAKKNLSHRCKNLLSTSKVNDIIFLSAHTARIFCSLILKSQLSDIMTNMVAYAMSKNIADNLKTIKWKKILISRLPTKESLIDTINKGC